MNKIDTQLEKIRQEKRVGLMTHVIVGYPSLQETRELVKTMAATGVDFVELQIPFSDPLADGPTIMKACEEALAKGTKVKDAFTIASQLTREVDIPLLFMAYYNTVFRYGVEKFCEAAKEAGISGLIIPDIPLEEEHVEGFLTCARKHNLYPIRVVSPASTDERLKKNARVAKGFVYCTARQGTTGAQKELESTIASYLNRAKKHIPLPLAVGFGISKRDHVTMLAPFAEVAVVGSALIDILRESPEKQRLGKVRTFLTSLAGVKRVRA